MVLLVPLAWVSGLVVYSLHDGRWGRLPWRPSSDWIDLHGSVAVMLWPMALLFAAYALTVGRFRLRQPATATILIGLILAVGSGKLMNEDWLRSGQFHHLAYSLHLLAWLLIAASLGWHVCALWSRGGWPLVCSMFRLQIRANDQPGSWIKQIRAR